MNTRQTERNRFLADLGLAGATVTALVPDASMRCYFRIEQDEVSMMLMDAPPASEHPGAFIKITHYLESLNARVPKIIAEDADKGLVLLEDLGNQTVTQLLSQGASEQKLYELAVDALLDLQHAYRDSRREIDLPAYDLATATAEADLFTHWYLPARQGRRLQHQQIDNFRTHWRQAYESLPRISPVFVHRDFHVDNLIVVDGKCAMLDYQDALLGSPAYDLISLLQDARRDVEQTLQENLKQRWLGGFHGSDKDFEAHLRFWGAQRHCKVAGIFVRLWLRDHKPIYLKHLPRVMTLLAGSLDHPSMQPLQHWIETQIGQISHDAFDHSDTVLRQLTGIN